MYFHIVGIKPFHGSVSIVMKQDPLDNDFTDREFGFPFWRISKQVRSQCFVKVDTKSIDLAPRGFGDNFIVR